MSKEKLPRGVARLPEWWLQLTPHHVLDLEEDSHRKEEETQEVLYYAQMAAADDGRLAREWKSNWGGRSSSGSGGDGSGSGALFGGRNFQPRSDGWDPKEWGVDANDPDYKSYLTGAKLPQSYIDAMKEFAGQVGLTYDASQLNHTAKYGSSASKPAFVPVWAKKKLKNSSQGNAIRQGYYNDSPNKHIKRRVEPSDSIPSTPALAAEPEPATELVEESPVKPDPVEPEPEKEEATPAEPETVEEEPPAEPEPAVEEAPAPAAPAPTPAPFVHTPLPAPVPTSPRVNTEAEANTTEVEKPKYNFNDYYYNHVGPVKLPMPEKKPELTAVSPKPEPPAAPQKLAPPEQAPPAATVGEVHPDDGEEEEEVEYEEVVEYVDDYEGEEGEEYEEIVEEIVEEEEVPAESSAGVVPPSADLSSLQALLLQKQAELAKLQGL